MAVAGKMKHIAIFVTILFHNSVNGFVAPTKRKLVINKNKFNVAGSFSAFSDAEKSSGIGSVSLEKGDGSDDNETKQRDDNETKQRDETGRTTLGEEMELAGGSLTIRPIGVVRSIYRLCVGTPRQGLLAPHARGRIELTLPSDIAADAVVGLREFSHIWILFVFHRNTMSKNGRVPAKIAPPALGGRKVGVFASRAPHRFNPVGMTLARLDRIQVVKKHVAGRKKPTQTVCLHISGLDLVDGTPVVDIKPYVPDYDAPLDSYNLPTWVSGGLATKRHVLIADKAQLELRRLLEENDQALEFYGGADEPIDVCFENVLKCIEEVLAIDVRSQWQTQKARKGKSQAERAARLQQVISEDVIPSKAAECTQQIDNLLIRYTVAETAETERPTSEGSGAEDSVTVTSIQLMK
jgi:tRNA-Thr(GGU) m(6)t(6)A37 methyltransferase TsaA